MRIHLFEFEDQHWFPQVIREGMMDYLRHMISWLKFYKPCAPLIKQILEQTSGTLIVDLCAGGGGGILKMKKYLDELNCHPEIFLSDLYPNVKTYEALKLSTGGKIDFITTPVNALDVPSDLNAMRIIFSAFHHFKPAQARKILHDAAIKNVSIGIFDSGTTGWWNILLLILLQPLSFLLLTPFFRPFRWSRLFFTYLIPLIPLCTLWDGSVSILRFYSEKEMKQLVSETGNEKYQWNTGHVRNRIGVRVNYIIGYN
ncbi:MAG: hypothetical protein ABIQ74_12280 [Chitinophagales bacterium]